MMRADIRTMHSSNTDKLRNGLEQRTFGLLRLFTQVYCGHNENHHGEFLKFYDRTGFVYLFIPWHRHALG